VNDTGPGRLPPRGLDDALGPIRRHRAIVVPNSRLAYFARLAFGEGGYRVLDDDFDSATAWLEQE